MRVKFDQKVRKALAVAGDVASYGGEEAVTPRHLLHGVLGVDDGRVASALEAVGADTARVRDALVPGIRDSGARARRGELPYTRSAKEALEAAIKRSRREKSSTVGPVQLALGVLSSGADVRRPLERAGLSVDSLRRALLDPTSAGSEASATSGRGPGDVWFVTVDEANGVPIYAQLVRAVEEAVARGRLMPGERLPSVRQLASEIDAAPGTVARAYKLLEERGVLVTEGARGTRVGQPPEESRASTEALVGLLRPAVVESFHLGASADDLRGALEEAMRQILVDPLEDSA